MQRHDDEVRNNVIHPSVICPCPFRPLATQAMEAETTKHGRKERGKKREKEETGARPTTRGNQQAKFLSRLERTQGPTQPSALFMLTGTMYVVANVNLLSFQKLSVAARLKATAHQACATYQATPCFWAPATGLLDPLNFPCTPPSGYRRIGFYSTFHQQTLVGIILAIANK